MAPLLIQTNTKRVISLFGLRANIRFMSSVLTVVGLGIIGNANAANLNACVNKKTGSWRSVPNCC